MAARLEVSALAGAEDVRKAEGNCGQAEKPGVGSDVILGDVLADGVGGAKLGRMRFGDEDPVRIAIGGAVG